MANLNPFQLFSMLKGGNPKQVAQEIIQNNFPDNPMFNSLLQMGNQGNVQGIQQFAQQYFKQQGRDFNTEMQNFMSAINTN